MPKRISAEAQVFKHFNLLSDESRRIVLDILNAWQQPAKVRTVQVNKRKAEKIVPPDGNVRANVIAASGD